MCRIIKVVIHLAFAFHSWLQLHVSYYNYIVFVMKSAKLGSYVLRNREISLKTSLTLSVNFHFFKVLRNVASRSSAVPKYHMNLFARLSHIGYFPLRSVIRHAV